MNFFYLKRKKRPSRRHGAHEYTATCLGASSPDATGLSAGPTLAIADQGTLAAHPDLVIVFFSPTSTRLGPAHPFPLFSSTGVSSSVGRSPVPPSPEHRQRRPVIPRLRRPSRLWSPGASHFLTHRRRSGLWFLSQI